MEIKQIDVGISARSRILKRLEFLWSFEHVSLLRYAIFHSVQCCTIHYYLILKNNSSDFYCYWSWMRVFLLICPAITTISSSLSPDIGLKLHPANLAGSIHETEAKQVALGRYKSFGKVLHKYLKWVSFLLHILWAIVTLTKRQHLPGPITIYIYIYIYIGICWHALKGAADT